MDKSSLFSALSLVSVMIYMYIGIYTIRQNPRSMIHKIFLLLCISYAIWSFAYAFAYVSDNKYVFSVWNKISALGWCSFSAITLYLVLLITENKIIQKKVVEVLIFSPAVLFLYMSVFLFGENIKTSQFVSDFFYIGNFLYNFIFLLISILILFVWGLKTNRKRIKIQSKILVYSSITPFCFNLLTQTILPFFGFEEFPHMGQIYSVIMILGTYVVITKYKFLRLPEKIMLEEIGNKIMDMVIIVNDNLKIIRISKHTLDLLGYDENELRNQSISSLFDEENREKLAIDHRTKHEKKYSDIEVLGRNGQRIPINITYIPIFDHVIHDFLGAVLVMQDIRIECELRKKNEQLKEQTIRDGLTKLYNYQYSLEKIMEEIGKLNTEIEKKELALMMLDIDYFKRVNDTYGHLFGDEVLRTVASILLKNIKENGYVGRYGGEEFIIILHQNSIDNACMIGEKIRSDIEKYKFNNGLKLTISIGIKQYRNESYIQLIKSADGLLYKAKQNGRNRIEYSE